MMARMLHIAPGLDLPYDVVTQAIAILARRGAGKSYTASVLVEEVVKAGLPVVVIDPTGAWYGLRTSADGKKPGLSVLILGGPHGDVQIEATAGREIADLVVDHPGAYVIDLSAFETKASELRFVADFLERLYRAKATKKNAMLLVVDEADSFAPQNTKSEGGPILRTLGALETIARRGRIRGFGLCLVTQRSAVLHKNVLAQTEVLIALQTTDPRDRAAIKAWVEGNGTPEEQALVLGSLASLERGEAWVWSPGWLRILKRVRIRRRDTFDSGRTPEVGGAVLAPSARAAVDLEALKAKIAASVEQAKANDPSVLKSRLSILERELAAVRVSKPSAAPAKRVEVPVVRESQIERLEAIVEKLGTRAQALTLAAGEVRTAIAQARAITPAGPTTFIADLGGGTARHSVIRTIGHADPGIESDGRKSSSSAPTGGVEQRLLAALAQFGELSHRKLAMVAGVKRGGSTWRGGMAKLRARGWLQESGADSVSLSAGGRAAAPSVERLPEGDGLIQYWRERFGGATLRAFDAIVAAYPGELTAEALATAIGSEKGGSTMRGALATLRKFELISHRGARAADELMS